MKKRLVAAALLAAMALTGCGGFTGEKTETLEADDKGNVTMATVTFEKGEPVSVNIDVETADGMKSELAANGEYVMANETQSWDKQVDALEEAIVANDFDLSKITLTNDEGNTDAVSGVTIKVAAYLEAVQGALDQVD